jgi:CheY-like chemotaxis protein
LDTVMLDARMVEAQPALDELHASHPGLTVRITVTDTGPGMEASVRERIFEPFFTTKPVNEGTGLGLSVVHGIVEGHEGKILVESQPGKGTTFTIYLPATNAGTVASSHGNAKPIVAAQMDRQILYLDDDRVLVTMVERLLQRHGLRVAGFTSQDEAIAAVSAEPSRFDLVVSDYNMPGMSGLDVARHIRGIRADLPVAIASGNIDEALRNQAEGAGVRELILKAEAMEGFYEVVQRLIEASSSPG